MSVVGFNYDRTGPPRRTHAALIHVSNNYSITGSKKLIMTCCLQILQAQRQQPSHAYR
jgi:hypothetical protein